MNVILSIIGLTAHRPIKPILAQLARSQPKSMESPIGLGQPIDFLFLSVRALARLLQPNFRLFGISTFADLLVCAVYVYTL